MSSQDISLPISSGGSEVVIRRRDFLNLAIGTVGVAGVAAAAWPFIDTLNPSADVTALTSIEVDLSGIAVGQRITVKWRGRPAFIVHRTPQEIEQAESVDLAELRDPQSDDERVQRKPWLIVVGVCTHAGCTPQGQRSGQLRGDWGGCRCTCHYSYYDTSGRIRRGPAPRNLEVPAYVFLDDNRLRIG